VWKKIGKLVLLTPLLLFGAELNFLASIDQTEVGLNQPLVLRVTVKGENIGNVPSPKLPDLPDFDQGPMSSSQSTSIQLINGKMTQEQTISHIYTLYPKKTGEFVIGSCILEFKGETYKTQPINVRVVKQTTASSNQTRPDVQVPSEVNTGIQENLQLLATVNRRNVYAGEQIIVEFAFYNRLNIQDLNFSEIPSFSGFWVEPIFDAQRLNFQKKTINNKLYQVALLKKSALFPVTQGRLEISPMKLNVAVYQAPRDFFDFYGTTRSVEIASDPIYINVKPLPETGKPGEFNGGVGTFAIKAWLDRSESKEAEPITLTIRINGTGNIKLIEKPRIPPIPGIKILDPEIKDNITTTNDIIKGYKEFRYPLIPQIDGQYVIPQIRVAYFDPRDAKYHFIETEKLEFTASQTASAKEMVQAEGIEVLGSDIHYIKSDTARLANRMFSFGWSIIFFYIACLMIITGAVLYRDHQARLLTDRAYARKLRASRIVRKRLRQAEHDLKKKDHEHYFAELSKVLLGYIGDRFNLDVGSLTNEQLILELEKRNIAQDLIQHITELISQCDTARFSGKAECQDPHQYLVKVKDILNRL
jgi:hypothetical protein